MTYRLSLQDLVAIDGSDGDGLTTIRVIMGRLVGRRLTYNELTNA